jgi:sugar lactone lactonase YvrE
MKVIYTLLLINLIKLGFTQTPVLEKIWETKPQFKTPESVLFYPEGGYLFVSNIDGEPDKKDGKGCIAKVALDGQIIQQDWVIALNAPKGLRIYKDKLYVTDLSEVIVVNIISGKIEQRIPIEGATFLNDIAVTEQGTVYVSDTRTGKVYRIRKGRVSVFMQDLKRPNGILTIGNTIYLLNNGALYRVDNKGNTIKLADGMDESTDGIEMISSNEFIISSWSGIVYYVTTDNKKKVLLDQRQQKINSADIGYNPNSRIVYIPTFFSNTIAAYQLK